jgi:hypothetical protein
MEGEGVVDLKEYWRNKLGIQLGMSKEMALNKYREWRTQKTCERCQEDVFKLREFCPLGLICKEEEEKDGVEIGSKPVNLREELSGSTRSFEVKPVRTSPKRVPFAIHRG